MFFEEAAELFGRHPWLLSHLQRINSCEGIADLSEWMRTRVSGINEVRGCLLDSRSASQIKLHKVANDSPKMINFRRRKHLPTSWTATRYAIVFREELGEDLLEMTDYSEQVDEKTVRFGTFSKIVEYGRSIRSTLKELKDWAEREGKNIRLLGVLRCVSHGQSNRLNSESYDLFPADENLVN